MFSNNALFYKTKGTDRGSKPESYQTTYAERKNTPVLISSYLINVINYFGSIGGFETILNRLNAFVAPLAEGENRSFVTVAHLVAFISDIKQHYTKSFSQALSKQVDLQLLVETGLANVSDNELKALKDDFLNKFFKNVESLLRVNNTAKEISQFIERIDLSMSLRLLNSQVLEKKINGMTKLQRIIKSIDMKTEEKFVSHSSTPATPPLTGMTGVGFGPLPALPAAYAMYGKKKEEPINAAEYLTPPIMVAWINKQKLLSVILDPTQHHEVVRRSPSVLKFLARQSALTSEHIELLWAVASQAHEALKRVVYETFADIAEDMSVEQLDFLFERIQQKPFTAYLDFDITYVKTFTMNAVKATAGSGNWYGLDGFHKMSMDSKVDPAIRAQASETLQELLLLPLFASQNEIYEGKAVDGLKLNGTFQPGFFASVNLLKLIASTDDDRVRNLESKDHVIDLVVEGANLYASAARAAKAQNNVVESEDVSYVANLHHKESTQATLDFIKHFLSQTYLVATEAQIDKLWEVFVIGAVDDCDRVAALQWFDDISKPSKFACLNSAVTQHLFGLVSKEHNDLTGAPIPHSQEWFKCFQKYFLMSNIGSRTRPGAILDADVDFLDVINFDQMTGLDALWPFVLAQDSGVADDATRFFCSLHIRLDFKYTAGEKTVIFEGFVNSCMDRLDILSSQGKAREAASIVALLTQFLDRLQSGEGLKRPLFNVNEKVSAFYKHMRGKKYSGYIKARNADGTYFVQYDDGDKDPAAPESNIFEV